MWLLARNDIPMRFAIFQSRNYLWTGLTSAGIDLDRSKNRLGRFFTLRIRRIDDWFLIICDVIDVAARSIGKELQNKRISTWTKCNFKGVIKSFKLLHGSIRRIYTIRLNRTIWFCCLVDVEEHARMAVSTYRYHIIATLVYFLRPIFIHCEFSKGKWKVMQEKLTRGSPMVEMWYVVNTKWSREGMLLYWGFAASLYFSISLD